MLVKFCRYITPLLVLQLDSHLTSTNQSGLFSRVPNIHSDLVLNTWSTLAQVHHNICIFLLKLKVLLLKL